jgi:hypothetical protein
MTIQTLKQTDIPDGVYGEATETIRQIIASAASLRWFVPPEPGSRSDIEHLVREHLGLIQKGTDLINKRDFSIDVVEGTLSHAADIYAEMNLVTRDDPYARGEWRRSVGEAAANIHHELQRPEFRRFIEPPLFPMSGKPGFLGGTLAATREVLASLTPAMHDQDRETVWWLMCDIEGDFWNAIQWQLARGVIDENPFYYLIQHYRLGFYPLGIKNHQFVIYVRA